MKERTISSLGFYIAQEKNFKKSDYNIIRNQMTTTCLIADFKKKV